MIDYTRGSFLEDGLMTIYCDGEGCAESIDLDGEWRYCIDCAKSEGWKVYKENDEWKHKCPDCKIKRVDEMFKD